MTYPNFKVPPVRDRKYLDSLRELKCVICRKSPCDPAHVRYGSGGGMGLKPGDDCALPLCHEHHMEQHRIGEIIFWLKYITEYDSLLLGCVRALARDYYRTRHYE